MSKEKQFYIKEVNVYMVMATDREEAISKVQNNKGIHQYSEYSRTY